MKMLPKYVAILCEKTIFYVGHLILKPRVIEYYFRLNRNEKKSYADLKAAQEENLSAHLQCAKRNASFYRDLIPSASFKEQVDLKSFWFSLPIVDKDVIKEKRGQLENQSIAKWRWKMDQTGGSTGTPLKYRLSKRCADMAFAILYRGWGRAGYRPGDRMAILAGGSLVQKSKTIKSKFVEKILNFRKYSSYGVSDVELLEYFNDMKRWGPKYIRGYVSSLYEFACFVEKNGLSITFHGVFTTAEMLTEAEREYMEKIFSCKVYNNYGLNDGAVSAFECREGSMHIDMERGYLEIVPQEAACREEGGEGYGRIIATAFLNDATYFIRYDTGDLGCISSGPCSCGSPYPVLKNIVGRKTDALHINGRLLGSPVLTVLMAHIPVKRYQFVQEDNALLIIIEKGDEGYSIEHEDFIAKSMFSQFGAFNLKFLYGSENFLKTNGGKHRVVVKAV